MDRQVRNYRNRLSDSGSISRKLLRIQQKLDLVKHVWHYSRKDIEASFKNGVRALELDVRSTCDGLPVISHSPKLGKIFGRKRICSLSFQQITRLYPHLPTLEYVFRYFLPYRFKHSLVIELKDTVCLEQCLALIQKYQLAKNIRIASLLPQALIRIAEKCPDIQGLIFNGGVFPLITKITPRASHDEEFICRSERRRKSEIRNTPLSSRATTPPGAGVERSFPSFQKQSLFVFPLGKSSEIVFSNGAYREHNSEGRGKFSAYVFKNLPDALVSVLKKQKGTISITPVVVFANLLRIIAPNLANRLIKKYVTSLKGNGLKIQATIFTKNTLKQIFRLKKLGIDTIYVKHPEKLAAIYISHQI